MTKQEGHPVSASQSAGAASPGRIRHALATIAIAGSLVAVLDGLDALIYFGIVLHLTPQQLFKNIAFALMGHAAFTSGWIAVLVGVCLHIGVAFGVAAVYFLLSTRLTSLTSRPYLWGSIYGIAVFLAMRYAILPLTHAGMIRTTVPFWTSYLIDEIFAHVFLVGIPIALVVRSRARLR